MIETKKKRDDVDDDDDDNDDDDDQANNAPDNVSNCSELANACNVTDAAFDKDAFLQCCLSANWGCRQGSCKHSSSACAAAAEELYSEGNSSIDCQGSVDLLAYHIDHSNRGARLAETLLERNERAADDIALDESIRSKAKTCKKWCATHTKDWETKCKWENC